MFAKRLLHLFSDRLFVGILAIGIALAMVAGRFSVDPVPPTILVMLLSVLIGLVAVVLNRLTSLPEDLEIFAIPLLLARDKEVFALYRSLLNSLRDISSNPNRIYRDLAQQRTTQTGKDLAEIAGGRIVFVGTETWRIAYERLLRSPGLHKYRSIAHVKTSTYWQDEPGRQSMRVNLEMHDGGTLNIGRIAVLPDHLWPAGEQFPVDPLCGWFEEQHNHGIQIGLVRESDLTEERDLIVDLGIYGSQAVGYQELDDHARTVCFTLSFDFPEVLAAEDRWDRLSVYAIPFEKLLDRSGGSE